ncbi:MAG TPA: methionyl-tRNA formyltransferase [Bryobacteraceae bacterium]|nr:methionyl-tRNA formyltransferase [Bryobacteraceae bacterium]
MRLVFLGTPSFAVATLERAVAAGHQVLLVVTQPDRPKGRGRKPAASPVKESALRLGLPLYQPERIRRPEAVEMLAAQGADAMVVVGYGQIIPKPILDLAPHGIINVHASLLPKYRGAAPLQWAVANGETRTGVTTMRIDEGLDTGDMLLKAETEIGPDETALELGARLAEMGAELLVRTLDGIASGSIVPEKQNSADATYAPILKKEDGLLDWRQPAPVIHNRIRGFLPWPGGHTHFRGLGLQIWKARTADLTQAPAPGCLLHAQGVFAGCGQGTALQLLEVQLEGRKRISAEDFANGQRLAETDSLGEPTR